MLKKYSRPSLLLMTSSFLVLAIAMLAGSQLLESNKIEPSSGGTLSLSSEPVKPANDQYLNELKSPLPSTRVEMGKGTAQSHAPQRNLVGLFNMSGQQAGGMSRKARISSVDHMPAPPPTMLDRERFPDMEQNPLKQSLEDPVSTFSIDVDTASYSFVRSNLNAGRLPKPDAVRIEEMVNYFSYDYERPVSLERPFSSNISVMQTPWNKATRLLHIGIQGYKPDLASLPPQNLVFLIDTSGSMRAPNKLPLLQQSFRLLLSSLRPEDEVAIVTYAGSAGVLLEPTKVADKDLILSKLNQLGAGGSTAGQAGLKQAYAVASQMSGQGEEARVILATDGDFNVGLSDPESLKRYVSDQRKSGTALSVLGFGRGNYNDALMQTLAQNGNGVAAYIDTLSEARKVLVDQMVSSLVSIAQDVKIQVEFNPSKIAEYRLVGYETRALKNEDFNNDRVDAGDIGAGHTVTAIYEITPVGSPAVKLDERRYGANSPKKVSSDRSDELAFVKIRYKKPGQSHSNLISTPVLEEEQAINRTETRFAAAVAAFGQYLKGSKYLEDFSLTEIENLARANRGTDDFGYRAEFLNLVRQARIARR